MIINNNINIVRIKIYLSLLHILDLTHNSKKLNCSYNNNIRIEDIHESNKQELILGTKGKGVLIWKNKIIKELTTKDGLASNMIEDINTDEEGNIYVGTLNGLSIIELDSLNTPNIRTFTMKNGLPSNEVYKIKIHKNQPWLCTGGGLVKWMNIPINETTYTPILSKIFVNGKEVSQEKVNLKYDENNLVFEFISLNYRQSGDIPFRYRLSKNDDWRYTNNLSVDYPKLSPFKYTFEIQAQNEDGIWSESLLHPFQISKHWSGTMWFKLACVLGFGIFFTLIFRLRIKRLQEKNQIALEIENLKNSALKAQMNPHFVFNCLNSLQSLINRNEKEKANMYLVHFSKLIRGFLNGSVENSISLENEIKLLENYLELEQLRFQSQFEYQIKVEDKIDQFDTHIPPMLIQPFVENAIIHGISNKNNGELGKINIEFKDEKEMVLVNVIDNGVGLKKTTNLNKNTKSNLHNSVGIVLTKRRLDLINQKAGDWFSIKEIHNNTGNTTGTKVSINIMKK